MKKRRPTLNPFAALERGAAARRGDDAALHALYLTLVAAVAKHRATPNMKNYLDVALAGKVYWTAVKATPTYPKGEQS